MESYPPLEIKFLIEKLKDRLPSDMTRDELLELAFILLSENKYLRGRVAEVEKRVTAAEVSLSILKGDRN